MFTGDSSYACAYLALGNRSQADAQLGIAFGHITRDFFVFTETEVSAGTPPVTTGTQHFITGRCARARCVASYSGGEGHVCSP